MPILRTSNVGFTRTSRTWEAATQLQQLKLCIWTILETVDKEDSMTRDDIHLPELVKLTIGATDAAVASIIARKIRHRHSIPCPFWISTALNPRMRICKQDIYHSNTSFTKLQLSEVGFPDLSDIPRQVQTLTLVGLQEEPIWDCSGFVGVHQRGPALVRRKLPRRSELHAVRFELQKRHPQSGRASHRWEWVVRNPLPTCQMTWSSP